MTSPIATYRIQFHQGFTFADAKQIIPYLHELGIDTIYASPIFEAVPGSKHGYDVVNPLHINPELGSLDELRQLSTLCKAHKLHWIQDIVPNHMAFHPANEWLMDVLEKGLLSTYAPVFDTGFSNGFFSLPLMAPFLGSTLEEAIVSSEISLVLQQDRLMICYFDQHYPVNILGYKHIVEVLKVNDTEIYHRLQQAILRIEQYVTQYNPATLWDDFFAIWRSFLNEREVKTAIRKVLRQQNANKEGLTRLCQKQWYRLCHWEESNVQINYRRFFTVNGLICLQTQYREVFDLTHQLIKELVNEGIFQGLRVDHVDGLFDPEKYLNDLRKAVGEEVYIVVEKILEHDERLSSSWPIAGTSGYDYLANANNLFIKKKHEGVFDSLYRQLVPQSQDIISQKTEKKALILHKHMAGEAENLFGFLIRSNLLPRSLLKRIGEKSFRKAVAALLIYFPVYRFYGHHIPLPICEREQLAILFARLQKEAPMLKNALQVLEDLLLPEIPPRNKGLTVASEYFYQRMMQFSGPLMAKGVEDTLMYTYNRFIGSNEVGNSPEIFGMAAKDFHAAMEDRQRKWPLTMNATATHDTKRGEDVRARLQALSCLPVAWKALVKNVERALKAEKGLVLPGVNDRYFIYQTLLGSFPSTLAPGDDYPDRLANYLQKALREAKINSNWTKPDEAYEQSCVDFVLRLLDQEGAYWPLWLPFLSQLVTGGMFNSLAQVLLKTMAPGIPDFYQGSEFWDLSFVDPDNRREVDYEERYIALRLLKAEHPSLLDCWKGRSEGKVKLLLTQKLLQYRKTYFPLFQKGVYLPIKVHGRYRTEVLAFCRRYRQQWSVCLIPIQTASVCADQRCSVEEIDWKDTRIEWPAGMPNNFFDVLNERHREAAPALFLAEVFNGNLPLAVLHANDTENIRAAGVLMAISSLPSAYGIGDIGHQARVFASYLASCRQRYWQLLPLNPSGALESFSPYSTYAVFAGNPLLISPEALSDQALLSPKELQGFVCENTSTIDYEKVALQKEKLLALASERFLSRKNSAAYRDFEQFMEREKEWLDDYALYLAIKKEQGGKAWYAWPEDLKLRRKRALDAAKKKYAGHLLALKWEQYEFFKEWYALKAHVEILSIRLLGDLPIYANHDSVDVWCNKQLFTLDKECNLKGIAGVPPDYFNAEGQLWGMPTFNWKLHEQQGYAWWIARLRRNLAWYHVVRLDHFRAFYDYWEVPAGEENAIAGTWKDGPRERFFAVLRKELGNLPLVAEDLGDIHEGVIRLRDHFGWPGMKVLQFAFGEDIAVSPHIPHQYEHNSVVYTGTHDNNTVLGWYKNEMSKADKIRLSIYLGHPVRQKHIHKDMIKMAYASVAMRVVIPLQDLLGLGTEARMNIPATVGANWKWRLLPKQLKKKQLDYLLRLTVLYNR